MSGKKITAATFNIKHGAKETEYRGDPDAVVAACLELEADILALQEVDYRVLRSGRADLASMVAKATGMRYVFEPTMWFRGGYYGNALFVNGDIKQHSTLRFSGDYRYRVRLAGHTFNVIPEPRNAILATVTIDGQDIATVATHQSTDVEVSQETIPPIVNALACYDGPQILLGDLNEDKARILGNSVLGHLNPVLHYPTVPASMPKRQIDHIAVSGLRVCAAEAIGFSISDHRALKAVLEIT